MDLDFRLAERCAEDTAFFRLYRWDPYCISLGANQQFDSIDMDKAAADGLEVVKRPTGGRAILHSGEMTYAVVMPLEKGVSPKEIYKKINLALIEGLKSYDPALASADLENEQPAFKEFYKTPQSAACFASSAKNELKYSGKKIIGSAQRKIGSRILQHGSILTGTYHKKLTDYLTVDDKTKKEIKKELEEKTIEIESILNEPVNFKRLERSLLNGFESFFNISFNHINIKFLKINSIFDSTDF